MQDQNRIPEIVKSIPLEGLLRIDLALEGDWSPTVVTVWSRENGMIDFSKATRSHPVYKPSLELYFEGAWLGIHCFERIDGRNIFDEAFAHCTI